MMNLSKNVRQAILPLVLAGTIPMVAMAGGDDLPSGDVAVTIATAISIKGKYRRISVGSALPAHKCFGIAEK